MKIAATVLILAFVGWGALFLSNSAILIHSETVRRTPQSQRSLICTYFAAVSVFPKEFWYSEDGVMGRAACPRLIQI